MEPDRHGSTDASPAAAPGAAEVVVIGAGLAGMAAAAALAGRVARVVLIEQDELPAAPGARKSVPQAAHAHALLEGGHRALSRLLPGVAETMVAAGSLRLQVRGQWRSCLRGRWNAPLDSGLSVLSQTRPLLDHVLAAQIADLPGLHRIKGRVGGLLRDAQGGIGGVELSDGAGGRLLRADLVIDASGRAGQGERWLRALDLPLPEAETATPDLRYLSAEFSRTPSVAGAGAGEDMLSGWLNPASAPSLQGAVLAPVERDRWIVTASTRFEAAPAPDSDAGFLAFLDVLGDGRIAPLLRGETRLTPFARYRVARTRLRRFDTASGQLPPGYLPVGDAIATFNPVHGQGMSVAALQAEALGDSLQGLRAGPGWRCALRDAYLPRALRPALWAWQLGLASDQAHPQFHASPCPEADRLARVLARAFMVSTRMPEIRVALDRVLHLIDPPESVFDLPRIAGTGPGPHSNPGSSRPVSPRSFSKEGAAS